jgi:hypothetical protein
MTPRQFRPCPYCHRPAPIFGWTLEGPCRCDRRGSISQQRRARTPRRPRRDTRTTRTAPRWAWDIIDETLELDQESIACDRPLREKIGRAYAAMHDATPRAQVKR